MGACLLSLGWRYSYFPLYSSAGFDKGGCEERVTTCAKARLTSARYCSIPPLTSEKLLLINCLEVFRWREKGAAVCTCHGRR